MTTDNELAGAGAETDIFDAAVATTEAENPVTETPEPEPEKPQTADELKTLQNRLARENRRIGKLTAQKYQFENEAKTLREQLAKLQTNQTANGPPQEGQFNNYGEYLKAEARYAAQELLTERDTQNQTQAQKANEQAWTEDRLEHVADTSQKAKAAFPDYQSVYDQNLDIIQTFPPHIEKAFLEADNPAYALYALAKDGGLEQLASMSATRAAVVIARAEDRAASMKAQVTRAPTPLAGAKGTAPGSKELHQMSGDELLKWVNS